jgi:hypothetical protein
MIRIPWVNTTDFAPRQYTCGFCGNIVGPNTGYFADRCPSRIYLCSYCEQPTYFPDTSDVQVPGVPYGNAVGHLPADVRNLYGEARNCMAVNSYTASVLTCRKILMNVAVAQGAAEGESFVAYVEYLATKGYVPPQGRGWVDYIRKKGNEANHEIAVMARGDAEMLISFLEMLLKFVYEFPAKIPKTSP